MNEDTKPKIECELEIRADVLRFVRHEAMRMGVMQEDVVEVIKKMEL